MHPNFGESSNKKCESTLKVVLIKKYYEKHRVERQAARGRAAPDERDNNSKTKKTKRETEVSQRLINFVLLCTIN